MIAKTRRDQVLQPPVWRRGALGIMLVAATVCMSVIPPRLMALATSTFTLSCDASSASPNPVAPGGTATLQASATSSQTYTDANILFDVFDSTGTRVYYI